MVSWVAMCYSLVAGGSYRFLRLGCVDDAVPLFANTHMGTGAHFADIGGMTGYVNSGPRQLELPYPTLPHPTTLPHSTPTLPPLHPHNVFESQLS